MQKEKCIKCSEYKRCKESYASWIFFIIGMVATIAIRAVTVLIHTNPVYGQVAWYIGVAGFLVFFIYKFNVDHARHKLIVSKKLMAKIAHSDTIETEDRETISAILCALSSDKDRINYLLIFVSSAIALVAAIYFDFLK